MRCSNKSFTVIILILIIMMFTLSIAGCNDSNETGSDVGTKVTSPTDISQESSSSIDYAKLLTTADVEQIYGFEGVKTVEFNSIPGAGGKLNLVNAEDELILAVMVEDASMFDSWKVINDYNTSMVPDLGDEAFKGGATDMITPNVTLKKGEYSVQLFTFFNFMDDMKPYLNHDQLIELAKIIEDRM